MWRGKFVRVPRVDEYVIIHEGWASDPVLEVHHNVFDRSILIFISPDLHDEYPEAGPHPEQI